MAIAAQVHNKFKVFVGKSGQIDDLARTVAAWALDAKVAPKSIGVEYLEGAKSLVLSIGYRDDEPPYPVRLTSQHVGRIDSLDSAGVARLEKAMAEATAKLSNIICHELFVTEANDFHMVFMTHDAK